MAKELTLRFEPCFRPEVLNELEPLLPATYAELNELAPWRRGRWPTRIHCMSDGKIVSGRMRGAGHGQTRQGGDEIWLNHHMTLPGHWIVLVHENLHHAFPDATESELNNVLVPRVYARVFDEKMDKRWARRHGLGPPRPGIGDRGFVR